MTLRSTLERTAVWALTLAIAPSISLAQGDPLVDIRDLTPREHRAAGFVLTTPQTVRIEAVGAEPWPNYRGRRGRDEGWWWSNRDERDTWPAAAWIIDARTREVVWDLRTASTERSDDGLRRFSGTVQLPAGVYQAHYGSFPATWTSTTGDGSLASILRGLTRRGTVRYGGPYVDDGEFRQFALTVRGAGRPATAADLQQATRVFTASAIATLRPTEPSATERTGFQLDRPTDVEVVAIGELRRDGAFDYCWIINADTRQRVWEMEYSRTEHAGGAQKNRSERETLHLPAGRYAAYFVSDDSHDPAEWNAVPPVDPDFWGLTLRVASAEARAAVKPFTYEPVPTGQTIVSLTGIGDRETRSQGFTLKQPLTVRIYAIGEGTDRELVDYAWIVDATSRHRVWTMRYEDTEHAGGADKNRLFDDTLQLAAGSYLVYYSSDDSHSADEWNSAPPAESQYWGVSVFPASGRLDHGVVVPFERGSAAAGGDVLAELVRMGNDERARTTFKLDQETTLRIYALGEGMGGDMYDYAWIENADTRHAVWEMTYRTSDPAGGARKNRVFDGTIRLPAGNYILRYESDGSHAYGDWNDDPPDDPEGWGVTVRRVR